MAARRDNVVMCLLMPTFLMKSANSQSSSNLIVLTRLSGPVLDIIHIQNCGSAGNRAHDLIYILGLVTRKLSNARGGCRLQQGRVFSALH